ncbi:MAG: hypothetical protein GYA51_15025 [Candidatus Methanofastidiosa archaeon]|nr:hypothetical protein [Candidatus Methanofastidiosa archaeon]
MGTRHVTAVFLNGEPKVAQYGQWDGYPSGQGVTILNFLRKANMPKFRKKIEKCIFLTAEQIKERWTECGADPNSQWVGIDVSHKFQQKYPGLHRDTGAAILEMIYKDNVTELQNSLDFVKDSLWCEWAYVIDLNERELTTKHQIIIQLDSKSHIPLMLCLQRKSFWLN